MKHKKLSLEMLQSSKKVKFLKIDLSDFLQTLQVVIGLYAD